MDCLIGCLIQAYTNISRQTPFPWLWDTALCLPPPPPPPPAPLLVVLLLRTRPNRGGATRAPFPPFLVTKRGGATRALKCVLCVSGAAPPAPPFPSRPNRRGATRALLRLFLLLAAKFWVASVGVFAPTCVTVSGYTKEGSRVYACSHTNSIHMISLKHSVLRAQTSLRWRQQQSL